MERKTILDRVEFDNETYEITGRTRSANVTPIPAPSVGELRLALTGSIASRERCAAPQFLHGRFPDDLADLRESRALAARSRQRLH